MFPIITNTRTKKIQLVYKKFVFYKKLQKEIKLKIT
jgi:hypothetical protein